MRLFAPSAADEHDDFGTWVANGYDAAFRTAYLILHNRSDAEEAVQDAFLRAWRFRAAIPAGDGVRPWLYRVVVNACLSKLRSDRTRLARTVYVGDSVPGANAFADGPPEAAEAGERQRHVLAAIGRLPDHLRVVVVLRYYAGLSDREIAGVIQRRTGTVKSRIHEAKHRLATDPYIRQHQPVEAARSAP